MFSLFQIYMHTHTAQSLDISGTIISHLNALQWVQEIHAAVRYFPHSAVLKYTRSKMACCNCVCHGVCRCCVCVEAGCCSVDREPYCLGTCQNTAGVQGITAPSQSTSLSMENSLGVSSMLQTNAESPPALGTTNSTIYSLHVNTTEKLADDWWAQTPLYQLLVLPGVEWWAGGRVVSRSLRELWYKFVSELTRLFDAFASCSALDPTALKAATVLWLHLFTETD